MSTVDTIIVGQGICGTLLSWALLSAGQNVLVIDERREMTSSGVASGLINPVTGMRLAKAWRIDEFSPVAIETYNQLSIALNAPIVRPYRLLSFHNNDATRQLFEQRMLQFPEYLGDHHQMGIHEKCFNNDYGVGTINVQLVDVRRLLDNWRIVLASRGLLVEEAFQPHEVELAANYATYKGIKAKNIVFCEGAAAIHNRWFGSLPFALNKGEVLIADIPELPRDCIYQKGLKIAPWENGLFWIGASFEWTYTDTAPTALYRANVEAELAKWMKLPYTIVAHWASVRPATVQHFPFAQFHQQYPCLGILNGMGAKGCSQAPYFALKMAAAICNAPV